MMRRIGVFWGWMLISLLWTGSVFAAKVNFASQSQGATVSAVSEHPSYLAVEAIDGDTSSSSSAWVPQMAASQSPWLIIDLGKPRLIDELKLYKQSPPPGPAMASDYTIEGWVGGRWQVLANVTGNIEPVHTIPLGVGIVAERVRITITSTERGGGTWPFLNEVQILGESAPFLRRPAPESQVRDKEIRLEGFAQPRSTIAFHVNGEQVGADLLVDETGHFIAFVELVPGRNEVKPVLLNDSGQVTEEGPARIVNWLVGAARGVVVDNSDTPLANVMVAVQGTGIVAYTDTNGAYELTMLPAGSQRLVFMKEGYQIRSVDVDVPVAATAVLDAVKLSAGQGDMPGAVVLQLGETRQAGIKLTWSNGEGAAYYHVYRSQLPITSSEQGELVAAFVTGTEWLDGTVESGKKYWYCVTALDQSGRESASSNVVSSSCAYLTGSVVQAAAPFEAIPDVSVVNPQDGSQVLTDSNGQFVIPVPEGAENVRLRFSKVGYLTVQLTAAAAHLDVEMEPLTVSGAVLSVIYTEAFPNPFSPNGDGVRDETTITYVIDQPASLAEPITVQIAIYNLAGQKVRTLFEGKQNPGTYEITWDGKSDSGKALPSGLYFYRVYVENKGEPRYPADQKPIVLIR